MKPALELPRGTVAELSRRLARGERIYVGPPGQRLFKQGICRVCGVACFGEEDTERDCCGHDHCRAEYARKRPCKFKRLRNVTVAP